MKVKLRYCHIKGLRLILLPVRPATQSKSHIFHRLGQGVSNLGRWRLQADQFLNMRLPQPPIEKREKIATFLDEKTAKIEALITDINSQLEKLKQYRQIIIHDAVTGTIKVSDVNDNGN